MLWTVVGTAVLVYAVASLSLWPLRRASSGRHSPEAALLFLYGSAIGWLGVTEWGEAVPGTVRMLLGAVALYWLGYRVLRRAAASKRMTMAQPDQRASELARSWATLRVVGLIFGFCVPVALHFLGMADPVCKRYAYIYQRYVRPYCDQVLFPMNGPWKEWYPNGQLRIEEFYVHGCVSGMHREWHANGRMAAEGRYDGGARTGRWTEWHPGGQKMAEGRYDGGEQTGWWTEWYPSGQKMSEGHYELRKLTGRWTWWYASGQKRLESEFLLGVRHGRTVQWAEDGKVTFTARYVRGRLVSEGNDKR